MSDQTQSLSPRSQIAAKAIVGPDRGCSPLQASYDISDTVRERFRALHARLSRYEALVDEKDARIAELEKRLA